MMALTAITAPLFLSIIIVPQVLARVPAAPPDLQRTVTHVMHDRASSHDSTLVPFNNYCTSSPC
jgi:hypothetical protein